MDRAARWARRKAKHRRDYNHGKCGWVGGNPRYNRKNSHVGCGNTGLNFRPVPGRLRLED